MIVNKTYNLNIDYLHADTIDRVCETLTQRYVDAMSYSKIAPTSITGLEITKQQDDYSDSYSVVLAITYSRQETEAEIKERIRVQEQREHWEVHQYKALHKKYGSQL